MQKIVLALLGFILLATPLAATAQQFGDFSYSSDGAAITITGYTGPGGAVTIPDTIAGLPVTRIGDYAFAVYTSITSVTISSGVTSIGDGAFHSCTSLASVTIPGSVTGIGNAAFYSCTSLASVTIPGSVTSIGNYAFRSCTSLASVTIPGSVISIGDGAIYNCTSLASVTIPDSVTSIGFSAFAVCTSLTAIIVDAANLSYSSLDGVLFNKSQTTLIQCPGGKAGSYPIAGTVTSIEDYAFVACTNLGAITVDAANLSYSSLDGVLFNKSQTTLIQCPGGKAGSYPIPGSVYSIGDSAFYFCRSLASVTIPGIVNSIGHHAFTSCTSLKGVFFMGNAPSFGSDVFSGTGTTVYYLPGTIYWGATFAGRPTGLWNPVMLTSGPSFGVGPGGFGFNITGTADIPIVVEASTNLATASWVPLQDLNLTNGLFYFSDPNWMNYPARSYRIRSP